jgi:cytidine deaminase
MRVAQGDPALSVRVERYVRSMRGYADLGVTAPLLASLRQEAQRARSWNYSHYSGFMVLAAVETREGRIFGGSNVENVNYTLTKHAEEVAVLGAIRAGAGPEGAWIKTLYVTGASPCGSCRQFVAEFGSADTVVLIDRIDQEEVRDAELEELTDASIEAWTLGGLLPAAFGPEEIGAVAHA